VRRSGQSGPMESSGEEVGGGPASSRDHRLASAYLCAQSTACVVWWLALAGSATVRSWFEMDAARREVLSSFVTADVAVLVVGSAVAASLLRRGHPRAWLMVAAVAGGLLYATLVLAAWVGFGGSGAIGLVPMGAAAAITISVAVRVAR
jgi:hypothetical protein